MPARNPEPETRAPGVLPRPGLSPNAGPRVALADTGSVRGGHSALKGSGTKSLLISGGVLLAMICAYNVAVWSAAKTSQRHQLLARLDRLPLDTDMVFLGNSLVEAGCDVSAFTKSWGASKAAPKVVNIALGATSPVEHYLILKRAYARPIHPRYIVYGFFDDQLNAPVRGDWSDLVGNRAFSVFFPNQAAALYSPGSWLKRWQLWLTGHIPMLAERSSAWGKIDTLRRSLEQIGMPKYKMNRFGRVGDFAALEARDVPDFNRRCDAVLKDQGAFSAPVRQIIRLAQSHGAQLILLEMPMPSHHRELFYSSPRWAQLRESLEQHARQDHLLFISASDWMQDDHDFEDATHLSEDGAKLFSGRLASALANLQPTAAKIADARRR